MARWYKRITTWRLGSELLTFQGRMQLFLTPIHVKDVVMSQGAEQIALVECDVTGFSGEMTTAARMKASLKTGIPYNNICVAATHTHMASELRKDAR